MALGLIVLAIGVTFMYLAYKGQGWHELFGRLGQGGAG